MCLIPSPIQAPRAGLLFLAACAAAITGAAVMHQIDRVEIAHLHQAAAERERELATRALRVHEQADDAAALAQAAYDSASLAIDQLMQERDHAITAAATGRACLGSRVLRVLDGAPGVSVAGLPSAASGAADAAAAASTDPDQADGDQIATDADVAAWAVAAGGQYEQCRARIVALNSYFSRLATAEKDRP